MISRVANKSFLFLRADQAVSEVSQVVLNTAASHIIVASVSEDCYYLFETSQASDWIAQNQGQASVQEVFDLPNQEPVPVLGSYDSEFNLPERVIVVDNGFVKGFIDSNQEPTDLFEKGGLDFRFPGDTRFERGGGEPDQVQRLVVTDFPSTVHLGETCSLLINLSSELADGARTISVWLNTSIDVIVRPMKGFELAGPREASMIVTSEKETTPLRFKFKAVEEGVGAIWIYLYRDTLSLGSIEREAQIVKDPPTEPGLPDLPLTHTLAAVQGPSPDLSLFITERDNYGKKNLIFELRTREDLPGVKKRQQFEPVELEIADTQQQFRHFFRDIDALKGVKGEDYLKTNGSSLFDRLFPKDLRNLFWSIKDRIQSIQIQSHEPWIPWELCRLQGREGRRVVPGPFLCEAYQMTRWLPEVTAKPALRLKKIALVVPSDSGLRYKDQERDFLMSFANADRQVDLIPADLESIRKAFDAGVYDGWHFICHGALDPNRAYHSTLRLEKNASLMVNHLGSGEFMNVGLAQPLVFLNACQGGQNIITLSGAGGWAEQFLKAAWDEDYPTCGAAAFIGAYWSINDVSAHNFAKKFYENLFGGMNIGESVQKARLAIQDHKDPTWLAYAVFAHPLARIE